MMRNEILSKYLRSFRQSQNGSVVGSGDKKNHNHPILENLSIFIDYERFNKRYRNRHNDLQF